jgi:hypothetical protein
MDSAYLLSNAWILGGDQTTNQLPGCLRGMAEECMRTEIESACKGLKGLPPISHDLIGILSHLDSLKPAW